MQLQLSVLSALKNLAIPGESIIPKVQIPVLKKLKHHSNKFFSVTIASNKHVLIEVGALECAVEFLRSSDTPSPLVFRAIAVIRLLVQGQGWLVRRQKH